MVKDCIRYVQGLSKVRTDVEEAGGGPLVRIGELARRAGLPPATLRAWERRYGVITPRRGDSGYRLYSETDELRLRRMTDLIASGLAPAEAARRALEQDESGEHAEVEDTAGRAAGYRRDLAAAFASFDERRADAVLDRAVAVLSIDSLLEEVLLPAVRGLEASTIGQEHFASNLIRGRLLALARGWGGGSGSLALLACPEGELHDLGLISFGLALRAHGWQISFLGANTPIEAIEAAAEEMSPEVIVLSALTPGAFERAEAELAHLASSCRLCLGGAAATEELAERVDATLIAEGPVQAAATVAA